MNSKKNHSLHSSGKVLHYNLLTSGELNSYITEIDKQAEEMFYRLVKEIIEGEDV